MQMPARVLSWIAHLVLWSLWPGSGDSLPGGSQRDWMEIPRWLISQLERALYCWMWSKKPPRTYEWTWRWQTYPNPQPFRSLYNGYKYLVCNTILSTGYFGYIKDVLRYYLWSRCILLDEWALNMKRLQQWLISNNIERSSIWIK